MKRGFPEADWKVLRSLRPIALDRLCQRVLKEAEAICADTGKSSHQRYLILFDHMQTRDRDIVIAFDGVSRSSAVIKIMAQRRLELVTDEEFARFSEATRDVVNSALQSMNK